MDTFILRKGNRVRDSIEEEQATRCNYGGLDCIAREEEFYGCDRVHNGEEV